jgi:hypothetical protein
VERQVMSTPVFLAWSLLASGVFASLALFARRRAVAKHGPLPPLNGVQSAIMAAMIFLLGAQVTALVGTGGFNAPLSPLSMPLTGAIVALIGMSGLYNLRKDGETYSWQRRLSLFNLGLGTLMLALAIVWP